MDLQGASAQIFLPMLDDILGQVVLAGGDLTVWQGVLSTLRRQMLLWLVGIARLVRAENLWQQARIVFEEKLQQAQTLQKMQEDQQAQTLRDISQTLITTFDVDQLMGVVAQAFPQVGIRNGYLCLYETSKESPTIENLPEWSRLILAYQDQRRLELESGGQRFPSYQLVPEGLLPRQRCYNMVVMPLYVHEHQLGFVVFGAGVRDWSVYEALRSEISSALHGALLVTALQNAQQEIVRLEKNALETQMAGGFAHEMRNALTGAGLALNTVITAEQTLCQSTSEKLHALFHLLEPYIPADRWDEVIALFQSIDHDQEKIDHALRMVTRCITNALDITTLILDYARLGKEGPGQEPVKLKQVLEALVHEHEQEFATHWITFRLQVDEVRPLRGHPAYFRMMLNNIVLNARDALLDVQDDRERLIVITLTEDAQAQQVIISDNANGILPEHLPQIFEPFFSTKPTTGTGLGLSFVSKLVPMYHGTIVVRTEPGQGTIFMLTFPLPPGNP